tara:strand:+ start:933 stop:1931 length:999 start_codon:yes stop_codon:yes gene_type:complete
MISLIPTKLDNFMINSKIANQLKNINKTNIINMIFIGKPNSGKKTLINALLNNLFKQNVRELIKIETQDIKIGNNKVSLKYLRSPYHYEINLYEYGLYDKNMVTEFIKEITKYKSIKEGEFKFIILKNIDRVSNQCQLSLRSVMDKTFKTTRFIFTAENNNKIDNSFLSRLNSIIVSKPKKELVKRYVKKYFDDEKIIFKILNYSDNNITVVNNLIYALKNSNLNMEKFFKLFNYTDKITKLIFKKNLTSVVEIRNYVYQLILLNIPIINIIKQIIKDLFYKFPNLNDNIKIELVKISSDMAYKNNNIDYDIIGLEFFILKVKKLLLDNGLL